MSRRREPRGSTAVFPKLDPATTCPTCRQPIPGTDGQCPCQWQGTFCPPSFSLPKDRAAKVMGS